MYRKKKGIDLLEYFWLNGSRGFLQASIFRASSNPPRVCRLRDMQKGKAENKVKAAMGDLYGATRVGVGMHMRDAGKVQFADIGADIKLYEVCVVLN